MRKKFFDLKNKNRKKAVSAEERKKTALTALFPPGSSDETSSQQEKYTGSASKPNTALTMGQFFKHARGTGGGKHINPPEIDPETESKPNELPVDLVNNGHPHHKVRMVVRDNNPNPIFEVLSSDDESLPDVTSQTAPDNCFSASIEQINAPEQSVTPNSSKVSFSSLSCLIICSYMYTFGCTFEPLSH